MMMKKLTFSCYVTPQYVLSTYYMSLPVSLLTQTSFHHTFCTVHTVHPVCSPLTLVVNITLTTIVYHIFSSVLAEPQLDVLDDDILNYNGRIDYFNYLITKKQLTRSVVEIH